MHRRKIGSQQDQSKVFSLGVAPSMILFVVFNCFVFLFSVSWNHSFNLADNRTFLQIQMDSSFLKWRYQKIIHSDLPNWRLLLLIQELVLKMDTSKSPFYIRPNGVHNTKFETFSLKCIVLFLLFHLWERSWRCWRKHQEIGSKLNLSMIALLLGVVPWMVQFVTFTIFPWNSSFCHACLCEQSGSLYANGEFVFEINFSSEYPHKFPEVKVVTPIYHPCVRGDYIRVPLFTSGRKPEDTSVEDILVDIRQLLSTAPDLLEPINEEVYYQMIYDPGSFITTVSEWVTRYARNGSQDTSLSYFLP